MNFESTTRSEEYINRFQRAQHEMSTYPRDVILRAVKIGYIQCNDLFMNQSTVLSTQSLFIWEHSCTSDIPSKILTGAAFQSPQYDNNDLNLIEEMAKYCVLVPKITVVNCVMINPDTDQNGLDNLTWESRNFEFYKKVPTGQNGCNLYMRDSVMQQLGRQDTELATLPSKAQLRNFLQETRLNHHSVVEAFNENDLAFNTITLSKFIRENSHVFHKLESSIISALHHTKFLRKVCKSYNLFCTFFFTFFLLFCTFFCSPAKKEHIFAKIMKLSVDNFHSCATVKHGYEGINSERWSRV